MKTDTIFYQLFQTFPSIFFELIGQPKTDISNYQFTSPEVKQRAFRFDGLFLPVAEFPELPIYFVEVQFQKNRSFMLAYLQRFSSTSTSTTTTKNGMRSLFTAAAASKPQLLGSIEN